MFIVQRHIKFLVFLVGSIGMDRRGWRPFCVEVGVCHGSPSTGDRRRDQKEGQRPEIRVKKLHI